MTTHKTFLHIEKLQTAKYGKRQTYQPDSDVRTNPTTAVNTNL